MRRLLALGVIVAASCAPAGPSPEKAKASLQERVDEVSETNFVYCAMMSDLASVKLYLATGMSPDVRNRYGRTPLIAALTPDPTSPYSASADDVARVLIEHGADVNARADDGVSPLALARRNGRAPIIALLESKGAKE